MNKAAAIWRDELNESNRLPDVFRRGGINDESQISRPKFIIPLVFPLATES